MHIDIRRTIQAHNRQLKDIAECLMMSRQSLHFQIQQGDKVTTETLKRIAEVLGCSVLDFYYTDETDIKKDNEGNIFEVVCPHCKKVVTITREEEKESN